MLKEHEYNGIIRSFNTDELVSVLVDLKTGMSNCLNILKGINDFEDSVIDDFELMDVLEEGALGDLTMFAQYAIYSCSEYNSINKLMSALARDQKTEDGEEVPSKINYFNQQIELVVDAWSGVSPEEAQVFKELAIDLVSSFAYILEYEFGIVEFIDDYESNGHNVVEASMDNAFNHFCGVYNLDPVNEAKEIIAVASVYKVKLPVFDEYPELEEAFESIMGPFLCDVDPDLLTLDIVKKVIDGTLVPSEVYKLFVDDSEGEQNE